MSNSSSSSSSVRHVYKLPSITLLILLPDHGFKKSSTGSDSLPYSDELHLLREHFMGRMLRCRLFPRQMLGDDVAVHSHSLWTQIDDDDPLVTRNCSYKTKLKIALSSSCCHKRLYSDDCIEAIVTSATQIVLESRWEACPSPFDFDPCLQDPRVLGELLGIARVAFGDNTYRRSREGSYRDVGSLTTREANDLLDSVDSSVLLVGPSCSGKTAAIQHIAQLYAAHVVCVRAGELMARVYDEDHFSPSMLLEEAYCSAAVAGLPSILLFDDLDFLAGKNPSNVCEEEAILAICRLLAGVGGSGASMMVVACAHNRDGIHASLLPLFKHTLPFPSPAASERRRIAAHLFASSKLLSPSFPHASVLDANTKKQRLALFADTLSGHPIGSLLFKLKTFLSSSLSIDDSQLSTEFSSVFENSEVCGHEQEKQLLTEMLPPIPMHRPASVIEPAVTMVTVKTEEWDGGPVVQQRYPTVVVRQRRIVGTIPWQWRWIVAGIRLTRIVRKSAKQQMKQFNKLQRQMIRWVLPRRNAMRGARAR